MKDLFERLEKYGPGWTLMFVVGENNSITMVLEYHDGSKNKPLREEKLLVSTWNIDIYKDSFLPNVLQNMHYNIKNIYEIINT